MTAATTADRRKRVFSDRTLTFGDLRAIHAQLASTRRDVRIEANDTNLFDLDLLPTVAAEEVFLRRVAMSVIGGDDESLQFEYDPGYIEVDCGADPAFRRPFAVICALLEAKPINGEHACGLDLATTAMPNVPSVALPEEATTRIERKAERAAAAAEKAARKAAEAAAAAATAKAAADDAAAAAARTRHAALTPKSSAPLCEPTPMIDPGTVTPMAIAEPPSRGLVGLLRRLWGGR